MIMARCLIFLSECTISWVVTIPPNIWHPLTNLVCSSAMIWFNRGLHLFIIIFGIILYTILQRAMGLNPLGSLELFLLGMRVWKVAFKPYHTYWRLLDSSTMELNSSPMNDQKTLKKFDVNPSGLGALFSTSSSMSLPTSTYDTSLIREQLFLVFKSLGI